MSRFFNMIPGTDACCILLYGDIGEYDDNVRSGDIARELLEAEALTGKVDVRINSNGGEVYSGIAHFQCLEEQQGRHYHLRGRHRRQHGLRHRPLRQARADEPLCPSDASQCPGRLLRQQG